MQKAESSKKINIIYLLGPGRSGTTLLATVLDNFSNICTLGEMHQFLEHLQDEKECSCGKKLERCPYWSDIISNLVEKDFELDYYRNLSENLEEHHHIPLLLITNKENKSYSILQKKIFNNIKSFSKEKWKVDSSKYIARYLRLKQQKEFNVKGIYLTRDVRGVINSFHKKVQTPKKPLSAILYYLVINFFSEVVYRLDKNVIKVKYEDFTQNPEKILQRIFNHLGEQKSVKLPESHAIPHIIGGNRMKRNKMIKISEDNAWKKNISRKKQIIYYFCAFPFMKLNNYKL
ncbi:MULTISPECIES: sulfotransferase [Mesonia]|uniref:Uncharacterized protein n=1 Tax=Mesonia oceanica TaxID=2687242 RepID=A0AC61Y2T0_9FLAO|nr:MULTISPECIES: sulfotransferase [Mesonia]MAN28517.1 hypothetical protein [Mesonia sp.]MAQ41199.1 hypothetical protein [Mesonia sp.]MBJ97297.1 hypothetical protein [Flavobacteriaceae bacterium]VVU98772.1 hypothetical protein FVB9532_00018 [Mesonia oceanica]|tara:strand:+ start:77699 stop:78565 length:867 start_codon:yes stop_codon:yes gene_type:complete